MENAIFKFNSGNGALLCSKCSIIIKTGLDFTKEEWSFIKGDIENYPPQYCDKHKNNK